MRIVTAKEVKWHKETDYTITGVYRCRRIMITKMHRPSGDVRDSSVWINRWRVQVGQVTEYAKSQWLAKMAGIVLIEKYILPAEADFVNVDKLEQADYENMQKNNQELMGYIKKQRDAEVKVETTGERIKAGRREKEQRDAGVEHEKEIRAEYRDNPELMREKLAEYGYLNNSNLPDYGVDVGQQQRDMEMEVGKFLEEAKLGEIEWKEDRESLKAAEKEVLYKPQVEVDAIKRRILEGWSK